MEMNEKSEAASIVISSNFKQREKILPSERAKSYQLRNECLKKAKSGSNSRDGKTDENSTQEMIYRYFFVDKKARLSMDLIKKMREYEFTLTEEILDAYFAEMESDSLLPFHYLCEVILN